MYILTNSNRFYLNGTNKRFIHLATLNKGIREYMCFADKVYGQVYIEEIIGGHLELIEEDAVAEDIQKFLEDKGVLDMCKPILSDEEWLKGVNEK